jgi:hypothetical protein
MASAHRACAAAAAGAGENIRVTTATTAAPTAAVSSQTKPFQNPTDRIVVYSFIRPARAALEHWIARLSVQPGAREVALSDHAENAAARGLYRSLGFRETGERTDEGELVARLAVDRAATAPRHPGG